MSASRAATSGTSGCAALVQLGGGLAGSGAAEEPCTRSVLACMREEMQCRTEMAMLRARTAVCEPPSFGTPCARDEQEPC